MIAAFGIAREVEPSVIKIDDSDVRGVHITRLLPDGSDRERGDRAKIMIGRSSGWPIVLAPPNEAVNLSLFTVSDTSQIKDLRPPETPRLEKIHKPNDLLGLAITEGIEDALSIHAVTGLGAWAAGSASRMPALADKVPDYIDRVTIVMDRDPAGRRGATGLAEALSKRNIEIIIA